MFWGVILRQGQNHKLSEADVIHVSNAALGANAEGRVTLYAKVEGKEFTIGNFEKGRTEQTPLDLYFRVDQSVEFGVRGKGEVHVSGYIEPEDEGSDEGPEDEDIPEDEEESEEAPKPVAKSPQQQPKAPQQKPQ